MLLNDTLQLLALQLQLDPAELIRFASEDVIGGYSWKAGESRWIQGSIFAEEGKTLYALIRALKPLTCVEIGSWVGCSATHIATALSVNGSGHVTAVDINPEAGGEFPKHLAAVRTMVTSDGIEYLAGLEDESVHFIFEDSSHGTDNTASIAALCKTKLVPGGVALFHDAGHDKAYYGDGSQSPSTVGAEVRAGLDRALGDAYRVYLAEPSDCGLAVYQRPKERDETKGPSHFLKQNGITPENADAFVDAVNASQTDMSPVKPVAKKKPVTKRRAKAKT